VLKFHADSEKYAKKFQGATFFLPHSVVMHVKKLISILHYTKLFDWIICRTAKSLAEDKTQHMADWTKSALIEDSTKRNTHCNQFIKHIKQIIQTTQWAKLIYTNRKRTNYPNTSDMHINLWRLVNNLIFQITGFHNNSPALEI